MTSRGYSKRFTITPVDPDIKIFHNIIRAEFSISVKLANANTNKSFKDREGMINFELIRFFRIL